jgi:hypothetical protein
MLIECRIRRAKGTKVSLGAMLYHFLPNIAGDHVAMVEDSEHRERLLAIREGYAIYPIQHPVAAPEVEPEAVTPEPEAEAEAATPEAVTPEAATPEAVTPEAATPDVSKESAPSEQVDLDVLSMEALRELYQAATSRKAHPASLRATLIERIRGEG